MWSAFYNLLLGAASSEEKRLVIQLGIVVILGGHIAYACGWFPGIASGFATRESVVQLQYRLENIQANQLLEAIEKEKRNVCKHLVEDNSAALSYSVRKRDELLREYRDLTGQEAHNVTCEELGIVEESRL